MPSQLTVREVARGMNLEILAGEAGLDHIITNPNLTKPGLELAGMFDFYEHNRIQIIGSKEGAFFRSLSLQDQLSRVRRLFEEQPPAFIFSVNVPVPELFIGLGNEFQIPVMKSPYQTTSLFGELFNFLQSRLAERTFMHGALMDINGVGVVITGQSGIGKSEVALELIRRGYMLVADDMIEIYQKERGVVIGTAPDLLKKYLEVRGSASSTSCICSGSGLSRKQKNLAHRSPRNLDENKQFDRLGLKEEKEKIFDTEVVSMSLPITEARNTATLVEAAAFDYKAKIAGYRSAEEFSECLNEKIALNAKKD
jgi:HPr kinase/phosphorylase